MPIHTRCTTSVFPHIYPYLPSMCVSSHIGGHVQNMDSVPKEPSSGSALDVLVCENGFPTTCS